MVVNDLNLLWPRGGPPKTDPPLVVDSNAELTPLITFQRLEPVSPGESALDSTDAQCPCQRTTGSCLTLPPHNAKILENLAAHVAPALGGSRTTKDQSSAIPSTNSCRSQDLRVTVSSVHFE